MLFEMSGKELMAGYANESVEYLDIGRMIWEPTELDIASPTLKALIVSFTRYRLFFEDNLVY